MKDLHGFSAYERVFNPSEAKEKNSFKHFMSCVQIGTYQMALSSKAHNKPFYVVAESFKFVRLYPLNQQDVPDKFKVQLHSGFVFASPCSARFFTFAPCSHSTKQKP